MVVMLDIISQQVQVFVQLVHLVLVAVLVLKQMGNVYHVKLDIIYQTINV